MPTAIGQMCLAGRFLLMVQAGALLRVRLAKRQATAPGVACNMVGMLVDRNVALSLAWIGEAAERRLVDGEAVDAVGHAVAHHANHVQMHRHDDHVAQHAILLSLARAAAAPPGTAPRTRSRMSPRPSARCRRPPSRSTRAHRRADARGRAAGPPATARADRAGPR